MLWELLLGVPTYPNAPAGILLALDFVFVVMAVMFGIMTGYFAVKLAPWKEVVGSSGGTLAILVDMGKRVHFVNMKNKTQYDIMKNWGLLSVAPTGLYKAVKQNCTVGIWSTRACVPLPVHLAPVAQTRKDPSKPMEKALEEKYGGSDVEIVKRPVSDEKSRKEQMKEIKRLAESYTDNSTMPRSFFKNGTLNTAMFYQFIVDEWNKWFMDALNPVLYKIEVHDLARGFAKLRIDSEAKGKMNLKLLIFLIAGMAAAAFLVLFIM